MERRRFLQGLLAGATAAPLGTLGNPVKPGDKVPQAERAGEVRCFVEDIYWDAPEGSHTQDRGLPVSVRLYGRGARARIVYKRWNGKDWVPHA